MSDDGKVIDIYEWRRPWKPGEFRGCAIPVEPTQPQPNKKQTNGTVVRLAKRLFLKRRRPEDDPSAA